ncbi:hypothetical protein HK096_005898, partial [Nowakowskiella sp. JEL0078]
HKGPGIYDEEFIDYLIQILKLAPKYGIKCFIDPHQDTWSRFSGGSGAPAWTFEVAGLDIQKFKVTGAAHLHQYAENNIGSHMFWPTNYTKLASGTMFSLFFGGEIFAPKCTYEGKNIQNYLQDKFIDCFKHLAKRLNGLEAVAGFEVINEPHPGYIGISNLNAFDPSVNLLYGTCPSALQSFALGDGISQDVGLWKKSWPWPTRKTGTILMNKEGVSCWLNGKKCIWREHGVWDLDTNGNPKILKPDYFTTDPKTGKPLKFNEQCYLPFVYKFRDAICSVNDKWLVFFEPVPNEEPPMMNPKKAKSLVYSPHWYDLKALFSKSFDGIITHDVQGLSKGTKNLIEATYFGQSGAKKNYRGQVGNIVNLGLKKVGITPCLIGECGIPMDINEKKAFETGDYALHTYFLDAVLNAMEVNLVNFTLWNYNPTNDNQWGDHWNGEDFSIYSPKPSRRKPKNKMVPSQLQTEIHPDSPSKPNKLETPTTPTTPFDLTPVVFQLEGSRAHHHHIGGRALDAVIRPYAAKIQGVPCHMEFDLQNLEFVLETDTTGVPRVEDVEPAPTEIFVPNYHYGCDDGVEDDVVVVTVSDGRWLYVKERQTLLWWCDLTKGDKHKIRIGVTEERRKEWSGMSFSSGKTTLLVCLGVLSVGILISYWLR